MCLFFCVSFQLEALLAEAEAMGMSGKELDAAREALQRAGSGA
jgi:hypothetical protein